MAPSLIEYLDGFAFTNTHNGGGLTKQGPEHGGSGVSVRGANLAGLI